VLCYHGVQLELWSGLKIALSLVVRPIGFMLWRVGRWRLLFHKSQIAKKTVESKQYEVQGYTVIFKGMIDKKRVINVFEAKYFNLSQAEVLMMANQQLVKVESIKELRTSSGLKTGRWQVIANKRMLS
jgi:hypothetical protein